MANKKAVLLTLAEYFAKKGMMNPAEYKAAADAPIRLVVAKRPFGSWARMQAMIKANHPDLWAKATTPAAPAPKATPKPKVAPKAKAAAPKAAKK